MKLKDLAEAASRIEKVTFERGGVECYHTCNVDQELKDLPSALKYIKLMRERMWIHNKTIKELVDTVNLMNDIILDAEIETLKENDFNPYNFSKKQ